MKLIKVFRAVLLTGTMSMFCFLAVFFIQDQGHSQAVLQSAVNLLQSLHQLSAADNHRTDTVLNELQQIQNWTVFDNSTNTKYVVILTYQRCGSTFFGRLFNSNSESFYQFEPLDAVYSALYGTEPGWNVPSDIYTYSNGTPRSLTINELTAVSKFLAYLFTCDFERLPTEYLVHKFWVQFSGEMKSTASYGRCLRSNRHVLLRLGRDIVTFCGRRFGDKSPERMSDCFNILNNNDFRNAYADRKIAEIFDRYRQYMDQTLRSRISTRCLHRLQTACNSHSLRVVKTVRATMDSMESLLLRLPNVKVIHLVRDPRPVALSRRKYNPSARSKFSMLSPNDESQTLIREAAVYCRRVVDDVIVRRRLERIFPGRLYSLTYEQLVDNPVKWAKSAYQFIGASDDDWNVVERFVLQTSPKDTVDLPSSKWLKGQLTSNEFHGINKECSEMLDIFREYKSLEPQSFHT